MKDKAFETLAWATRKLRGSGLKKVPGVSTIYDYLYKSLEPEGSIRLIDVGPFEMYLDTRDVGGITPNLMSKKGYHPFMTSLLPGIIKPGMTCIDIGANVGYFTIILSKLVRPLGIVYAFEPEPKNFRVLLENTSILNLVSPYSCIPEQIAVGDKKGELKLYTTGYNFGGHSAHMESNESIDVEVTTLDKYLFGGQKVDFIKIDVEGYEPEVIEGMSSIIDKNPNLVIILEHMPGQIDVKHLQSLEARSFTLYMIDEVERVMYPISSLSIKRTEPEEGVAFNILARRL